MYLVDSKSSEFVVKVSAGTIFPPATSNFVSLHQIARCYTFTLYWLFQVQLVTNSNSQFSEVIALNPSFFLFVFEQDKCPSLFEKNFHLFMFKEFRWPENTDKLVSVQNFFTGSSRDHKNVDGRFVMKNYILLYIKRNFNISILYRILRKFTCGVSV